MGSIPRTIILGWVVCLVAVAAGASRRAAPPDPNRLFVIERSLNANVVVYDAVTDGHGHLDPNDPVKAYWLLNADKGERENLNLIEKAEAYGVSVESVTKGNARITVKALKDRPIWVRIERGRPQAIVRIAGHEALLRSVFVQSEPDHPLSVRYVELHGVSLATHAPVRERIRTAG